MAKRTRNSGNTAGQIDQASIESNTYTEQAGARKVIPAGWILGKVLGNVSTAVEIQPGTNFALYNNSGTVAFVGFYPTGAAIVPSATNSVAIPPNSYLYLNSGANNFIISSAAAVIAYQMYDETKYSLANQ